MFSHKNINQTHRNNCLQYTFARYFYNASELYIVISNLCFFPAYKQILNTYRNTRNTRYTKYTAYHQQKNNKQNRINANENEIRIPAHLYALSHMSYTQYSLTNQHEHETTTNETLQSNGRTAREGVPTYTQTYTHTIHIYAYTHTHTYSDPAAWLSLSFSK